MKAVILAGGYGTRISEESSIKPKLMVQTGDGAMTGGRLKRVRNIEGETYCFTYVTRHRASPPRLPHASLGIR